AMHGDATVDAQVMDAGPTDASPRSDAAISDMASLDMAADGALNDMTTDMAAADMAVDGAPADVGPDLASDMGAPDMQAPDMAQPDRCARWIDVADDALVAAVHAELIATYAPVEPELDRGGNLNRYTTARHFMFTQVERVQGGDGVEGVYTGRFVAIGPDEEPDNDDMNAEHVWPRSRMAPDEGTALYEHQQSDVHHLHPSDSTANSTRGSSPFGVVVSDRNLDFLPSIAGRDAQGDRVFEPRDARKGDIARAIMYFSIRWGRAIEATEEGILRGWVVADPVDDRERRRNTLVEAVQGNRNPLVDCPALVPRIADFAEFMPADRNLPLP
ncbi:MAG: deoxyribonuclease-1, partial [Bradymonadia bacterium]